MLALSKYASTFSAPLFIPAFRSLRSSFSILLFAKLSNEAASTVAVVVPSPASLTVFLAASFIKVAPIFSTGCNKTTLSATVTPSFVITGLPRASSYITHFPEAPNVLFTALANLSTPSIICSLADLPNVSVLRCHSGDLIPFNLI